MPINPRHGLRPKKQKETRVELKRRLSKEVAARKEARRLKRLFGQFNFETRIANIKIQGNPKVIDPNEMIMRRRRNRKRTFKT